MVVGGIMVVVVGCGGLWWVVMVCGSYGGLRWFVLVCVGLR